LIITVGCAGNVFLLVCFAVRDHVRP
jgi:hypothetical protein